MAKKSKIEKIAAKKFGASGDGSNPPEDTCERKLPETEIVSKKGWFFAQENNRLRYGDNRLIEAGITHTWTPNELEKEPDACGVGMHASPTVWDALGYAPGSNLWRVTVDGIKQYKDTKSFLWMYGNHDKFVGNSRTYHQMIDFYPIIKDFTREKLLSKVQERIANGMKFNQYVLKFLQGNFAEENVLDHMEAVDINNPKERECYDWVWCFIYASKNPQIVIGYRQILRSVMRYNNWMIFGNESFKELEDLVKKHMNLKDDN